MNTVQTVNFSRTTALHLLDVYLHLVNICVYTNFFWRISAFFLCLHLYVCRQWPRPKNQDILSFLLFNYFGRRGGFTFTDFLCHRAFFLYYSFFFLAMLSLCVWNRFQYFLKSFHKKESIKCSWILFASEISTSFGLLVQDCNTF